MTPMATGFGNSTNWALEGMWVGLAVVAHAAFIGGMPRPPDRSGVVALGDSVDMSFVEEEAEPEEVEEPAAVKPPPKRRTFRAAKNPSPPKGPPAAAQESPAAFDHVGSPNAAATGESKMGVAGGVIGGTGRGVVIDMGDLSREPAAPPLNRTPKPLEPNEAGAVGVEGEAFVRLQISTDGVPSDWQVIAEKPRGYGLGKACVKTLKSEAWQAPLDEDGKPVTARIIYRCGYEIWY